MRHFSIKIILLCVLLPPILYSVTLQLVEKKIQSVCERQVEELYIGDTAPLFDGSVALVDAVDQNISRYLANNILFTWGAKANITVITNKGTVIYPAIYRDSAEANLMPQRTMQQIAVENFALLSEGLRVTLDLKLSHTHFLSLAILFIYICSAIIVLYVHYQSSLRKILLEEREKEEKIARIGEQERAYARRLLSLKEEKEKLLQELEKIKKRMNSEIEKAIKNEDEMISEIVALEEKLEENLKLQDEQKSKIEELTERTEQFEKSEIKSKKQRIKNSEAAEKRFATLYKNISFHSRSVSGFSSLTSELQLKAEEIILRLNDDPQKVPVKRKVFGKKNRETVFEVIFAYKGRLYFRNTHENKIEILSIGTKHTQTKDLNFLDNL